MKNKEILHAVLITFLILVLFVLKDQYVNVKTGPVAVCEDYGLVSGATSISVEDKKINGIKQAKYIRTQCEEA